MFRCKGFAELSDVEHGLSLTKVVRERVLNFRPVTKIETPPSLVKRNGTIRGGILREDVQNIQGDRTSRVIQGFLV